MNTLQQIEQLAVKAVAENRAKLDIYELTNLVNISLIKKFDELEAYCDVVEAGRDIAEANIKDNTAITSKLESTCNAYELLMNDNTELEQKLAVANNTISTYVGTNKKVVDQAIEIRELSVYKRKAEVAEKNWKAALDKLQTMKDKAEVKPAKKAKGVSLIGQSKSNKALQAENARLNQYIKELVEYGSTSPQFLGGMKHSVRGVHDFVDLKVEKMCVKEKGSDVEVEKLVQRVVVINQHNSAKIMTRVIGEAGLHNCTIPKGGIVKVDKEHHEHIDAYFVKLDEMNEKIKQQKQG